MSMRARLAGLMALLCLAGPAAHAGDGAVPRCSFVHDEIMTAISNPPAGREKEYHEFFEKVHLPEIVSRGIGFESAQRFRVLASVGSTPWNYLSVYGLEQGNQIAQTGMKFRPGPAPVVAPAPYLAEGSVAWILRRTSTGADECSEKDKVFVVIPPPTGAEPDPGQILKAVPGLVSAQRYEFVKSTKGPAPSWKAISVFRAREDADVPAMLQRLAAQVGCSKGVCAESSGAVWALEPMGGYITRADLPEDQERP
ncbi:MAG TPA: hypothetical protein VIL32_17305 [Steroidobacteraceae bacterium]